MPTGRIRLAAANCVFTEGSGAEIHSRDLLLFFQPAEQLSARASPELLTHVHSHARFYIEAHGCVKYFQWF